VKLFGLSCLIVVLIVPCLACGAGGDWSLYLDASTVNRITCIGDSLWCATDGGILLFDLVDSTLTQYINGLSFRSNEVTSITVDGGGSVWVGFVSEGIVRIDDLGGDPFVKRYTFLDWLVSEEITSFAVCGDDVYYGSMDGAAKFDEYVHIWVNVLSDSLEGKEVYDLLAVGDTLLWVACEDGVARFNTRDFSYSMDRIGGVTSLCEFEGSVHCASGYGVLSFDGAGWNMVGYIINIPVSVASGGGELACVAGGVPFRWDGSTWVDIRGDLGDPGNLRDLLRAEYKIRTDRNTMRAVAVDSRGTPWIGGEWIGANRGSFISGYTGGGWINRGLIGLSQNDVTELDTDPSGGVWSSSRYYGISYMSVDGVWIKYTDIRQDIGDAALSDFRSKLAMRYDSQGILWSTTINGGKCENIIDLDMLRVNNPLDKGDDEWAHFSRGGGKNISDNFQEIKEDPAGNRWFLSDDVCPGMEGIDITSSDTTVWLNINRDVAELNGMEGWNIVDCAFGFREVYLAIKNHGLQVWYTGGFEWDQLSSFDGDYLQAFDSLTSNEPYAVEAGTDGSIWLGTANGLYRYNRSGGIDSLITAKTSYYGNGLVGSKVEDLEFDSYGYLWVASDGGLDRIAPDNRVVETYTTARYRSEVLGDIYGDEVDSPMLSHHCTALRYDEVMNVLWIGTNRGLVRLDLSPPPKQTIPVSRVILYPNPLHISRGDEALMISNISGPVDIQVFNVNGELVHEAWGISDGEVAWDLLTKNGYRVRSGMYIVRVEGEAGTVTKKVAVIR